jgi:hypothetical protein
MDTRSVNERSNGEKTQAEGCRNDADAWGAGPNLEAGGVIASAEVGAEPKDKESDSETSEQTNDFHNAHAGDCSKPVEKVQIIEATPEQALWLGIPEAPQGAEQWVGMAVKGEVVVGHICLTRSMGEVFGSNTRVFGDDPTVAARLWFAARKVCRGWGISHVNVHFTGSDGHMLKFWEDRGFEPIFVVYRGEI